MKIYMIESLAAKSPGVFLLVWSTAITVMILLLLEAHDRGVTHGFPFGVLAVAVFVKFVIPLLLIVITIVWMLYAMSFNSPHGMQRRDDEPYLRPKRASSVPSDDDRTADSDMSAVGSVGRW
jgi:hypothetical protein